MVNKRPSNYTFSKMRQNSRGFSGPREENLFAVSLPPAIFTCAISAAVARILLADFEMRESWCVYRELHPY
jgi:hypothetical protein